MADHMIPTRHSRTVRHGRLGLWTGLASAPYLPIAAFLAFGAWARVFTQTRFVEEAPLANTLPYGMVLVWILAVAIGGTLSVLGGLTRHTRTESAGLGLLLAGSVIYAGGASYQLGNASQVGISVAIALMCFIRLRVLAESRRADKKAHRLDLEDEANDSDGE